MLKLANFVDLSRYPIHDPDGEGADFIAQCRSMLEETALCSLPNFLTPKAITMLQDEVSSVEDHAFFNSAPRPAYIWRANDEGFADDHPVRVRNRQSLGSIARTSFDEEGPLLTLYRQDALREFVRRTLGYDELHRVECPYLSMNVKVMAKDDEQAWHFDQNDGVVSLLIQCAGKGGEFEYSPYIRDEDDENYGAVARLFSGDRSLVKQPGAAAGTFSLFKGRRSIHRVTPVEDANPARLIALFSYDRKPGLRYPEATLKGVLGESYASKSTP